jgi:uncharacterized protein (TIGR00255 family)
MTGFGVGVAELGQGRIHVEVRSVNHRYLDIRVRLPEHLQEHGLLVEQLCRERLQRGRYDLCVHLNGLGESSLRLDVDRARTAYQSFLALRDELAPGQPVPLSLLDTVPGLFTPRSGLDSETTQKALVLACERAFGGLLEMRKKEGQALQRELLQRLERARELSRHVGERSGDLVDRHRVRLKERVSRLIADSRVNVDSGRLELEIALLAEKADIAEELARLESHFDQFAALAQKEEPIGRSLDFLLQEIARETNTVGSKCGDADVSHRVVELKSEVERLREQVQNVE